MDAERYFVRPFTERDYEASSHIDAVVNPEFTFTAKEQRHWEEQFATPHLVDEKWVVEERRNGTVVAVAGMGHSPFMFHPRKFWTYVVVDPAHRGRGIGRALAGLLESEAASHQALCFWTSVRKDDARSLEFTRRLGFAELRRVWMSTLDLSRDDLTVLPDRTASLEREGIRFTTLAEEGPERPEVRQELFDLLSEASRDVPRMGEFTPISFEQFVGEFASPSFLPDGTFLAVDGKTYAAMSNFERSFTEKDGLRVGFTGTRAAYRGRGIASELKRRALEYARGKGIRYVRTMNDSLNLPMWAINQKQGFRRTVEWINQERRMALEEPPKATSSP
ncbi:MAG: GNAT family N-acetyltransferase [Thermoplasmata archaeon]